MKPLESKNKGGKGALSQMSGRRQRSAFTPETLQTRPPRHASTNLLKVTCIRDDRVLCLADYSSQIGKERLLVTVGVARDDVSAPGGTMGFDRIKVLTLVRARTTPRDSHVA